MLGRVIAVLSTLVLSTQAVAHVHSHAKPHEFMPANTLHLQDNKERATGITQEQFNAVIQRAEDIYKPLFQQFGATLEVKRLWDDATVNASAEQVSATLWRVNMYGGLARREEVTEDGFAMVLCHEIGHHLGGYPFVQAWAADEGQSDYYATSACASLVFKENSFLSRKATAAIPDALKAKCDSAHSTQAQQDMCYRSIVAGKSLADLLGALGGTSVGYETPDTSVVSRTNHQHPAAQCRFDTYAAGAYCGGYLWDHALIPGKEKSNRNGIEAQLEAFEHSCPEGDAARPKCWFAALTADPQPEECPLGDQALCDMLCQFDPSQPWCD